MSILILPQRLKNIMIAPTQTIRTRTTIVISIPRTYATHVVNKLQGLFLTALRILRDCHDSFVRLNFNNKKSIRKLIKTDFSNRWLRTTFIFLIKPHVFKRLIE